MIICRYNGKIHCSSEAEVFDALCEFLKAKEHATEEYDNLEREYNRLFIHTNIRIPQTFHIVFYHNSNIKEKWRRTFPGVKIKIPVDLID